MQKFKAKLTEHLQEFSTAPYLFIGSGFSRRYLNMETWGDLLSSIIGELDISRPYQYFASKAKSDNAQIASLLAEEIHESWWSEPKYKDSRDKFSKLANPEISAPLKYEIAKYINGKKTSRKKEYQEELELLKKVNVDGIITTNWDSLLEEIFPDFNKYIGQEQLLFLDKMNIGEIYKIHGCITDPNSLVLTTEDYDNYDKKNAYLAAKLLTIFVEHPVIFIGYSLSDPNIIKILTSIVTCLTNENISKLKDRLLFVTWDNTVNVPKFEDGTLLLTDDKIPLLVKSLKASSFKEIFETLSATKRRLPVKVLRQMKDMIYEFVKTNKPSSRVLISEDIPSVTDVSKIEYYFGIGIKDKISEFGVVGLVGLKDSDLIEDLLTDSHNYSPQDIVTKVLPEILKGGRRYIPIFKYLNQGGFLDKSGKLKANATVSPQISKIVEKTNWESFYPAKNYVNKKAEIRRNFPGVKEIIQGNDLAHALYYIPLLHKDKIDTSVLKRFLKTNFNDKTAKDTYYKKVVCLYDFLIYGFGE